jgi:Protein of unknown function (DUF2652)
MTEQNTTILIPDISGYTEFLTTTELNHGSLAINVLLDAMIKAVGDEYEVSEVEGDALLLVKKGPVPSKKEILDFCLKIFNSFHFQRAWMEQHTICPCNACLCIRQLTLKFIVHHGPLTELKVGRVIKQSGPDMIVAHRLLKNSIDSNEYLLVSEKLWQMESIPMESVPFEWSKSSEEYSSFGKVDYRYALLDEERKKTPAPPSPETDYPSDDTPYRSIPINKNYKDVYMVLKNIPGWGSWMPGLLQIEQDFPEAFLGSLHSCTFEGYKSVVSPLKMTFSEDNVLYAETCRLQELNISVVHEYIIKKTGDNSSVLDFRFLNTGDAPLPAALISQLSEKQREVAEKLKEHCEEMEGSFF